MADTDDEPIIRAYIERMLAIAADDDDEPDQAMLEAIAAELGLSDADVQRANQLATDHQTRARHFLKVQRWDDAIGELTQAVALRPHDVTMRLDLAAALTARWEALRQPDDRNHAEKTIRKVLDREPDRAEAYALLQRLDEKKPTLRRRTWLGVAVAVAAVYGVLVVLDDGFLQPDKMLRKAMRRPLPVAEQTLPPLATPVPAVAASPVPSPRRDTLEELDLPLRWQPGQLGAGLQAQVTRSRLSRFREPSLYRFALILTNRSPLEYRRLDLRLRYLDGRGQALKEEKVEAINAAVPPLRPGDELAVGELKLIPRRTAAVEAVVSRREAFRAPSRYGAGTPVGLTWSVERPDGVDLAVRRRRQQVKPFLGGDKFIYEAHFEVHNKGEAPVESLQVEADLLDAAGRVIKSETRYVVSGEGETMQPGHRRLFQVLGFMLSGKPAAIRLRVSEIE